MKEFKFCGEMTEYVEIPVYVCETQKEMVKKISEIRDVNFNDYVYEQVALIESNRQLAIKNRKEYGYSSYIYDEQRRQIVGTGDETSIYVIYKDGSTYFETFGETNGKFKRYGIKAAVIETAYEYTVFGDFAVTDNGDISIEESDIEEYGVYAGQYDVTEQTNEITIIESVEAEAEETVESVEETTISEMETVEAEIDEKVIIRLADDEGNVLCVKVFTGTYKEADEECERIAKETGFDISNISYSRYTDRKWAWMSKEYYCGKTTEESALAVISSNMVLPESEDVPKAETQQIANVKVNTAKFVFVTFDIVAMAKQMRYICKWYIDTS